MRPRLSTSELNDAIHALISRGDYYARRDLLNRWRVEHGHWYALQVEKAFEGRLRA
ncbi:MAG: hypothetical protein KDJ24_04530 [Gammaproteobacteria bacterium]|nr:hypothetical protein [Gammaproteobacteria bacterium]